MGAGREGGASHCENTALATSFEISSTLPLEPPILKENRKTAARKMKKGRRIIKKSEIPAGCRLFFIIFFYQILWSTLNKSGVCIEKYKQRLEKFCFMNITGLETAKGGERGAS